MNVSHNVNRAKHASLGQSILPSCEFAFFAVVLAVVHALQAYKMAAPLTSYDGIGIANLPNQVSVLCLFVQKLS